MLASLSTVFTFNGTNGQAPRGELIADFVGNLYGTTFNGGAANDGTVFVITESGFSVPAAARPEADVTGNDVAIADGDATPDARDFTDFGSVAVGSTFTRTFKLSNATGKNTLAVSDLKVPAGFTIVEGLPSSIAKGASDTFTIRLDATALGTYAGDVTFTNTDNNENPYSFAIRGVVIPPFATIAGRVLSVPGTAGNDGIGFAVSGATAAIKLGSATQTVALADFDKLEVQAGNGDDRVDLGALPKPAYLSGGSGADTLVGGEANDTILGGGGGDRIYGRGGNDRLRGSGSRDYLYGEAGDDRVEGEDGDDYLDGGGNKDRVYGGEGNDSIIGGSSVDRLYGDAGNDSFIGGPGGDYLFGGDGTDVDRVPDATDILDSIEATG